MQNSLCAALLLALPSDVRKGSAFPRSDSLLLLGARLRLAVGKQKGSDGKPEAFRTSGGIAAANKAHRGSVHHRDSREKVGRLIASWGSLLLLTICAHAQVKVTIDHNNNRIATQEFKFKRVPAPSRTDAAAKALLKMVDAEADGNSADVSALIDGQLPESEDQTRRNFFLNAGSGGGRVRMDLGGVIEISQVNSYSWHTGSRGPQVYRLWVSDGLTPNFNAEPNGTVDPGQCGWTSIAIVDTRTDEEDGGQYGVSISDSGGSLGKFRYLLFDFYPVEVSDNFGNTFYSEIDVIAKK